MIQAAGRLVQETITTVSLAASILLFSMDSFRSGHMYCADFPVGNSLRIFLGYSLNSTQTPARREMEYFRVLGGSKESAKELKLFGLSTFLVDRYTKLSDELFIRRRLRCPGARLFAGILFLRFLGSLGITAPTHSPSIRHWFGLLTLGTLTLLAGAIAGASSNIRGSFVHILKHRWSSPLPHRFTGILLRPSERFFRNRMPSSPRSQFRQGFDFKNVSFSYPGSSKNSC